MDNKKLLIVDDSPAIHMIIEKAVKAYGYECYHAKNGQEATILYEANHPDIVTMDITMPVKDGLCASREILEKYPDAKILMLSAMGDDQLISEAKEMGITHFMSKPFKGEEILNAIDMVINN